MAEAIGIGEAAARSQAAELRRYSLPKAEYEALRKRQIVRARIPWVASTRSASKGSSGPIPPCSCS